MRILGLNAGSSTLKFGVFESEAENLRGTLERTADGVKLTLKPAGSESLHPVMSLAGEIQLVLKEAGPVVAIGVRVVHGGVLFTAATRVNPKVVEDIRSLAELAPLHNGPDADLLEVLMKRAHLPIVAVFDTAFHSTLPALATTYALPKELAERLHIRRYGFHGISYRFVVGKLAQKLGDGLGRFVICHLGSGASVCAIRDGVSVETSMGFTPLEGLVMGTRSGDLDPGAVIYLARHSGMSADELDKLLNYQSGLLGVSGLSADVRKLEEYAKKGDPTAEFALELFAYRVAKYVGAYSVVLEGLDGLVFTGGIGENSHAVRKRVCDRLNSLGIACPRDTSADAEIRCISGSQKPSVWVVRTDEEMQIATETCQLLACPST